MIYVPGKVCTSSNAQIMVGNGNCFVGKNTGGISAFSNGLGKNQREESRLILNQYLTPYLVNRFIEYLVNCV